MSREPHKFDPKRAERLDHPERQEFLPNEKVLDLLGLRGDETVVDYGAGSGTLAVPLATRLPGGVVHAIDESPEMVALLRERLEGANLQNVVPYEIPSCSCACSSRIGTEEKSSNSAAKRS